MTASVPTNRQLLEMEDRSPPSARTDLAYRSWLTTHSPLHTHLRGTKQENNDMQP